MDVSKLAKLCTVEASSDMDVADDDVSDFSNESLSSLSTFSATKIDEQQRNESSLSSHGFGSELLQIEPYVRKKRNSKESSNSKHKKNHLPEDELQDLRLRINSRERKRMHDLNSAMDALRTVMPYAQGPSVRKISKIGTLLLAKNYILMLQDALDDAKKRMANSAGSVPLPTVTSASPRVPLSTFSKAAPSAPQKKTASKPGDFSINNLLMPSSKQPQNRVTKQQQQQVPAWHPTFGGGLEWLGVAGPSEVFRVPPTSNFECLKPFGAGFGAVCPCFGCSLSAQQKLNPLAASQFLPHSVVSSRM